MKTGIELIADERARQISAEGWTEENDDRYESGELIDGAASYIRAARERARGEGEARLCSLAAAGMIPWPWEDHWWKPSEDNKRNLVKAGALIAAELDRIQRSENAPALATRKGEDHE